MILDIKNKYFNIDGHRTSGIQAEVKSRLFQY